MPLAGPTHANACASRPRSRTTACTSAALVASGVTHSPGGGRAEAEPGQPGAQPVPQLPLGLRDRHAEHQPPAVPRVPLAHEAVDPPGALLEQRARRPGSAPTAPGGRAGVEVSRSSLAVRVRAWRADFSSTPRAPSASSRVAVHTEACRGCTNSPSTVSSSERALAEPTSRRREAAGAARSRGPPGRRRGVPIDPGRRVVTGPATHDSLQTLDDLRVKRRVLVRHTPTIPEEVPA